MEESRFRIDEISIRSLLKDLIKNSWLLILASASALFLLYAYGNVVYVPEYTSTATMVVSAKGSGANGAYADLVTTNEMAKVFTDVFSGNVLKNKVLEEVGSGEDFSISAYTISETNILVVSVKGESPRRVYDAINAVLKVYPNVSNYIFSNAVLTVLDKPVVPTYPSNAFSVKKSQKSVFEIAIIGMSAVILIVSLLRKTVKTELSAKRKLNGEKLALLGHEEKYKTIRSKIRRKGKSILITNRLTKFGYVETFKKLSFRLDHEMSKQGYKVLLVCSSNENEGKSTVATNISLALSMLGKKVFLVDLDLRRPALYKIFEKEKKKDLGNGFWLDSFKVNDSNVLFLLLNKRRVRKPVRFLNSSDFIGMLDWAKENSDYVVIDTSPMGVAADTEAVSSFCDASIMVVRQDSSLVKEINHNIELLKKSNPEFLGYILNDFESPSLLGNSYGYGYGYGKKYGYYD